MAEAQSCFDALNKTSSLDSKKIDAALKFLQSDNLQRLNDKDFCEKNFINYFGENYSVVLNAENLREVLKKFLGNNIYSWYSKKFNCKNQLEDFAKKNYLANYVDAAQEKIFQMSAEDAKKYLIERIKNDALFGIRILKDS